MERWLIAGIVAISVVSAPVLLANSTQASSGSAPQQVVSAKGHSHSGKVSSKAKHHKKKSCDVHQK